MRNNLLSIGEVARMKGVGIKALRYYERIGVLLPAHVDSQTGYRYYALSQMPELDVVVTWSWAFRSRSCTATEPRRAGSTSRRCSSAAGRSRWKTCGAPRAS